MKQFNKKELAVVSQIMLKLNFAPEDYDHGVQVVRIDGDEVDMEVVCFKDDGYSYNLWPGYVGRLEKDGEFLGLIYWDPNLDNWDLDVEGSERFAKAERDTFIDEEFAVIDRICITYGYTTEFQEAGDGLPNRYHLMKYVDGKDTEVGIILYPNYECTMFTPSGQMIEGTYDPDNENSFL